ITAIIDIKYSRENINLVSKKIDYQKILDFTRKYTSRSNIRSASFEIIEKDALKEYQLTVYGESKNINAKELNVTLTHINNIKVIDNFGWSDQDLINAFEAIQKQDLENALNTFVNEFDDSIENFKVIGDKPQCKTHGIYRDITEFGDGLKHYISIICALYAAKDGYLFVDEIDNGIHYSQLDRLWELILTLSKKTNCQVFATTHSKEMLESFARVTQKLHEQDISYTTLVKDKKGDIKAITRNDEMLIDSIAQEREVRGW
ncbi:MAG: AAA family ATPase, partial [Methylococcales bacterium]|nr:AAA family ATPase [Methylococcales bacterium]